MKSIILSIVLATALIACEKDQEERQPSSLTGRYQWIKSTGGPTGGDIIPPAGEVITLHLLAGNRYEKKKNNLVTNTGTYLQKTVTSLFSNKLEEAIVLSENPHVAWLVRPVSITSGDPVITFQENCTDCYEHFYKVLN
jgi:hypothetical protein